MKLSDKEILREVRSQLAIDLNCSPEDFDRDGFVFAEAKENPGRRPFPRGERHFEMLTMGGAVIVSATPDLLPYIKKQLEDKSRDDAFSQPFVYGSGVCFLPDNPLPLPLVEGFSFGFTERKEISGLYALEGFKNALNDINHPRPDVLAMTAKINGTVIGMAGASIDCETLWQIGIDVLPEYRRLGIAAVLTNRLALEIMERGKIPYYTAASSNVASQRTAHRAGLRPAWVCAYRGLFDGVMTHPGS